MSPVTRLRQWKRLPTLVVLGVLAAVLVRGLIFGTLVGQYAYLRVNSDGSPVRWDPCAPIHYVMNLSEAPAGAGPLVHKAVARIAEPSGLRFVFDGHVDDLPGTWRDTMAFPGSGRTWRPVLITWVHPLRTDLDLWHAAGKGIAVPVPAANGGQVYASGMVVLNAEDGLRVGWARPLDRGPILLHELGHLVGLGHVPSTGEIMNASLGRATTNWGPGDLAGLEGLGAGEDCRPALV